jgi:two-component system C4-dicarboxylate transport sensor histidine kinase DctB
MTAPDASRAGDAVARLAHEVRNPLTAIQIDLQRVEEALPSRSDLLVPLRRALREVARLDRVVSGALRVTRSGNIESGLIDLAEPLRHAIEVAGSAFAQSGSSVELAGAEQGPIAVRGDASALEQVFLNLLLNAAQALRAGGRASVSFARNDGLARVVVRDGGVGMDGELLGKAFDPFVTTRPDGTGLGLSIARQIVLAHGGFIELESAPGVGTTVRVSLPLAT